MRRLVPTPEASRCNLVVASAYAAHYGALVGGHIGAGKTATIVELSAALGAYCLVVAGSALQDSAAIGQMFAGVAQSGSLVCLDDIQRAPVDILSLIGQHAFTLQQALLASRPDFFFEGRLIALNASAGLLATISYDRPGSPPVLPDNLRAAFRPVTMSEPDPRVLAAALLARQGLVNDDDARAVAFSLSRLLSSFRLLPSAPAIGRLASLRRIIASSPARPPTASTIARAALHELGPGLSDADLGVLRAMTRKLFGVALDDDAAAVTKGDDGVGAAVAAELAAQSWASADLGARFLRKVDDLQGALRDRRAVILVGAPASGKSLCTALAVGAMSRLASGAPVARHAISTVAVPPRLLVGQCHPATRKWTDGIVTRIVRSPDRSVIVFDGPLPDTPIVGLAADRLLTLPTGERLLAPPSVSIVFEAGSLADAAPSAIVRCAVIHFEPDLVSPEALIRRWAVDYRARFPDPVHETLVTLLLDHTSAVAAWVMASCVERVRRTSPATLTTTLLSLLDALLQPDRAGGGLASDGSAAAGTQESTARLLSMYFLFAMVWSAGATCDSRSQLALSSYLRSRFAKGRSTGVPLPPEQGTLFDYYVGGADRASYQHWSQRPSAPFTYDPSVPFSSLRVATLETARAKYLLELAVSVGAHSLLVGASGVGKTSLVVDEYLGGANRDALVGVTVQLASWTTSTQVQAQVEARLETKRRGVVGPPVGKKLVVFVDDLHEAGPGPVELIRNAVGGDGGGGYHEHDRGLQFKRLVDCVFVGALQTSAAHDLAWHPRLLRHFHVVSWADPNEACFASVFGPIVTGVLRQAKDMEKLSEVVVTMTSTVYAALAKVAPLHGLHGLHDVFQGVARIAPATLTPTVLARAWAHEMRRVFRDRFEPGTAPFQTFSAALHDQLGKKFPGAVDPSADDAALQFGDVVAGRATYGEVVGGSLDAVIGAHLERYNQAHVTRPMHLVMFPEAVAHLLRIGRVLGVPGGHLVLVGPAGCGRRSLTRLAAHIAGAECVAVDLDAASEYDDDGDDDGTDPLQASIRRALEVAVVDHRRVVLLVNLEGPVDGGRPVAQRTLDDVVALVTGNRERICAMYGRGAADLDDLLRRVQVNAESLGHAGLSTPDEIVDHLLGALRANLHAVVAAAAAEGALLPPALLARCTVDRLQAWSHDALVCIAQQFMRAQAARLGLSPAIEAAATRACVAVHESVVVGGAGPAAFLELVRIYLLLVQERREQQGARADRYAGGLGKLRETGAAVDQMRAALVRLQPELAQASADTAALLAVLERDQQVVGEQSFACARDTADCADVTQRVEAIRDECQRDLAAAMPALDAAVASLDTINKDDLAVVKSFANPPKLVELVMSAVCLLMGEPQTWSSAKRLLSDMQILDLLRRFDKDAISNRTMKKLQVYIDNAEFDPDNCRNVSLAATSLCSWVCAIYRYALVADQIEPKRKALQQAQDDLARAQALLAGKTDALADLQARLAALRVRYQDSLTAQANLRALVDTTGARLARAEDLVARLSGQKARWQAALDALDASARTLPGDALLAAGQITYAGALSDGARRDLLRAWVGYARDAALPVVDAQAYALAALFADPVVVRAWCASGLPPDAHSVENGVIVERARRWPLLLDPQGQGNRWVKRMGRARGLRVLTLTSAASSCAPVLEAAIRAGEPVLIEDVGAGDLDRHRRLLDAILVKQLFRKGGAGGPWHLQMGEGGAAIPYHADFRLYLTTRLLDAGLSARASALVTVVDFRLVPHVLDQHLLTIAARIERPDLDQRHAGLLRQVADGRRQLADLDDRILSLLASSAAGLLDDADLATTLSTSETMARALEADVAESEATLVQIEVAREPYRVVAERASAIYFAMCDMSSVRRQCRRPGACLTRARAGVPHVPVPAGRLHGRVRPVPGRRRAIDAAGPAGRPDPGVPRVGVRVHVRRPRRPVPLPGRRARGPARAPPRRRRLGPVPGRAAVRRRHRPARRHPRLRPPLDDAARLDRRRRPVRPGHLPGPGPVARHAPGRLGGVLCDDDDGADPRRRPARPPDALPAPDRRQGVAPPRPPAGRHPPVRRRGVAGDARDATQQRRPGGGRRPARVAPRPRRPARRRRRRRPAARPAPGRRRPARPACRAGRPGPARTRLGAARRRAPVGRLARRPERPPGRRVPRQGDRRRGRRRRRRRQGRRCDGGDGGGNVPPRAGRGAARPPARRPGPALRPRRLAGVVARRPRGIARRVPPPGRRPTPAGRPGRVPRRRRRRDVARAAAANRRRAAPGRAGDPRARQRRRPGRPGRPARHDRRRRVRRRVRRAHRPPPPAPARRRLLHSGRRRRARVHGGAARRRRRRGLPARPVVAAGADHGRSPGDGRRRQQRRRRRPGPVPGVAGAGRRRRQRRPGRDGRAARGAPGRPGRRRRPAVAVGAPGRRRRARRDRRRRPRAGGVGARAPVVARADGVGLARRPGRARVVLQGRRHRRRPCLAGGVRRPARLARGGAAGAGRRVHSLLCGGGGGAGCGRRPGARPAPARCVLGRRRRLPDGHRRRRRVPPADRSVMPVAGRCRPQRVR